jgi:glycosyltransferase involved in cell wall biosynthesis
VPLADEPNEVARFDVNLAPLEIGNPYCEAKSELKYYQAALVGVPTIASATQPFREAIKHGETGFLASTGEEWHRSLTALLEDPTLRKNVATAARAHTLATYGPQVKQEAALRLFLQIAERARQAATIRARTVTFVLPGMDRGSGGHRNVILMARGLARHGYRTILTFTGATSGYPTPESLVEDWRLYEDGIRVFYAEQPVQPSDITFATLWSTVYTIRDSALDLGAKFHFVQDYEALFYPMGTDHLRALNALDQDFRRVTWGSWLKDLLASRHGLEAQVVPIPIDHELYRVRNDVERRKNLVAFFARPEMPRRCFELGVRALEVFHARHGSEFEIVLFGSSRVPAGLPFPCRDLGLLQPPQLAELYSTATVGLAFSPTNPSSVPYEMMACGLPVIDLDVHGNAGNYGGRENVVLVRPDERKLADALFRILSDECFRADVARKGLAFARSFPSEEESAEALVRIVEQEMHNSVEIGAIRPPARDSTDSDPEKALHR